jgi:hypothetical protein
MPAPDPRGRRHGYTSRAPSEDFLAQTAFWNLRQLKKIKMVVLRRPSPKSAKVEEAARGSRACANEPQQDFGKIQSRVRWTNVFSTRNAWNANAGAQRFNVLELRTRYHVGFLSVTTPNLALFLLIIC